MENGPDAADVAAHYREKKYLYLFDCRVPKCRHERNRVSKNYPVLYHTIVCLVYHLYCFFEIWNRHTCIELFNVEGKKYNFELRKTNFCLVMQDK